MKIIEDLTCTRPAGDLKPGDIFQSTQDKSAYYLVVDPSKFPNLSSNVGTAKIMVLDLRTAILWSYYKEDKVTPITGELKVSPGRNEGGRSMKIIEQSNKIELGSLKAGDVYRHEGKAFLIGYKPGAAGLQVIRLSDNQILDTSLKIEGSTLMVEPVKATLHLEPVSPGEEVA